MSKRVIIIHGWADDPTKGWMHWLKEELEQENVQVVAPIFPRRSLMQTDIEELVRIMSDAIGDLRTDDVLVGHSMGVPLILRYLSNYHSEAQIRGLVMVAGIADHPLMRPNAMFDPPLDFAKVAAMAKKRISIYSDDDKSITLTQSEHLAKAVKAERVMDLGKGHFAGMQGLTELPSALEAVQSCFPS